MANLQVLINTDRHVTLSFEQTQELESEVVGALARFADRLTRVEAFLSDQNADKGGATDLQCALEARPAGAKPVAVTHLAPTAEQALNGAVAKMRRLLDTHFGRADARRNDPPPAPPAGP